MSLTNTVQGQNAIVTIDVAREEAKVSPTLHGAFFEEISHAGDGGLYAELIQNRGFEDANVPEGDTIKDGWLIPPRTPSFTIQPKVSDWRMRWNVKSQWPGWSLSTSGNNRLRLSLTDTIPLSNATPHSLCVEVKSTDRNGRDELINKGYWGINVVRGDTFFLKFYIRTDRIFKGPLKVSLQKNDGQILATHTFNNVSNKRWHEYKCSLIAHGTDNKAQFAFSFGSRGTLWLDFVSLFPAKTFKYRQNGLRPDLAKLIADLHPAFIRWPGGCFAEGINIQSAFNWKNSIGPLIDRRETYSPWGYWCTNGFGYYEFLQFCEDIGASPLLVVNVGVSDEFQSGTFYPRDSVPGLIQNTLEAIQYAIGPVTSKWGKLRAIAGHPNPFSLKYIEIGNEQYGPDYAWRYNQFYKAIKAKYPQIKLIASMGMGTINRYTLDSIHKLDIADEHLYKPIFWAMRNNHYYDKYSRKDWKIYVGEYACNGGVGSGNLYAALNDAVFNMDMERNSGLVTMSSYAPLLANVNRPDWGVNLINFDDYRSFGRISYYVIKMFSQNKPDVNLLTHIKINKPAKLPDLYKGSIGISTWDTYASFKDIKVIKMGRVVYSSENDNKKEEWEERGGHWYDNNGVIQQSALGAWPIAYLKDKSFDNYTLTLKARKDSGTNAFMIPFAIKNGNNYLRVNIGAWINSVTTVEMVSDGSDAIISNPVKLPITIENGKWYDVKLRVDKDSISCYLNGNLLISYKEPKKFFSIAGYDSTSGDIIVKMVNVYDHVLPCKILLNGINKISSNALFTTLAASSPLDENSLENPKEFVPQKSYIKVDSNPFFILLSPFSINVLRIHSLKNN